MLTDWMLQVLVVGNPANTNCMVAQMNAPSIPAKNFSCLTRLDMNRAKAQVNNNLLHNINKEEYDRNVKYTKKFCFFLWYLSHICSQFISTMSTYGLAVI